MPGAVPNSSLKVVDSVKLPDASETPVAERPDVFSAGINVTFAPSSASPSMVMVPVTGVSGTGPYTITVDPYNYGTLATGTGNAGWANDNPVSIFVYGSEYKKGQAGRDKALQPQFTTKTNNPIIIKDYYEVSGSDASQIGWVEVATEDGTSGYLWYLKAESETRLRFEDYLEMTMVEHVPGGSNADGYGTEGMLHQIENGGHVFLSDNNTALSLDDFDSILKKLDKQGAIEENMLFLNRAITLEIDDLLAGLNSYGSGGTSYGLFDNDENMALNLGFTGFRRGSYDFYKTDWRYLNDATTRG